ncbi:MAG TPA: TonB family protein [Herbaspirillum sp.]
MLNRFPAKAFLLAVLVELILAAGAAVVLAGTAPVKPALSEPVPLTLVSETLPEPEQKPLPKPPEPPKTIPKPTPKPKTAPPKPQPPATAPVQPVPQPEPAHTDTPTAFTQPAQAAAPPPPARNTSGKTDRNAEYAAKVRAAVQAAVVYPPAAASLHFSGRVRVEFHLRDGAASQARVLIPSGIGMIDRAALQSVQNAAYPAPPAELRGSDLLYQVWVDFQR